MTTFSYLDTGKNPSEEAPERFYHGFVLGVMVGLQIVMYWPLIGKADLGIMM